MMNQFRIRFRIMVASFLLVSSAFVGYQVFLSFWQKDFLQSEGANRSNRLETVAAMRGIIFDRNGEPLAISTPVFNVVVDPSLAIWDGRAARQLAQALGLDTSHMLETLRTKREAGSRYMRLAKRLTPEQAARIEERALTGLYMEREYRRFYPAGEITAHLVGTTDSSNRGMEGLEYAYDRALSQQHGKRQVLRNEKGEVVKNLGYTQMPRFGEDLILSIDLHLQHHAHRVLKDAFEALNAKSAALIMLDARSGEIMALANQPSFNPNAPFSGHFARKNRAVTDSFEPGSTIKPFVALAALKNRTYRPDSVIDTSPGYYRVGRKLVEDPRDYGALTLAGVIAKSSQVGISKVALHMHDLAVFEVLERLGFGVPTLSGLPFEEPGELSKLGLKSEVVRATLAYGYGLSVTPMQLVSAYLTLATGGIRLTPSVFKRDPYAVSGKRMFAAGDVEKVMRMLEQVVTPQGTAWKAHVPGYRVAGKTGTIRKVGRAGYDESRHATWFVGMVPAYRPRFVLLVQVDEPKTTRPSGGSVSAPIFADVASLAVRHLGIAPERGV